MMGKKSYIQQLKEYSVGQLLSLVFGILRIILRKIQRRISFKLRSLFNWLKYGLIKRNPLAYLILIILISFFVIPSSFLVSQLGKTISQQQGQQIQQQQHFSTGELNLADSSINSLATSPATHTHTYTAQTQADFEGTIPNDAKGFGYHLTHTSDSYYYNKVTPLREIASTEEGLVGLWHMNNNWQDSSGNNNHGTGYPSTNPPIFDSSARLGSHAGSFDGVEDYVDVGTSASLNSILSSNFTISFWMNLNTTGAGRAMVCRGDAAAASQNKYICVQISSTNKVYFSVRGDNGEANTASIVGATTIAQGTWYHIVAVRTIGSNIKLYVNGNEDAQPVTDNAGSITFTAARPQTIGAGNVGYSPSGYFPGLIDEVAIYNQALSPETIKQHYEAGSPREATLYRSPRFDLGVKTKPTEMIVSKTSPSNTDLKVYARSGNSLILDTDTNIDENILRDTSKEDFDAGTGSNWQTTTTGELKVAVVGGAFATSSAYESSIIDLNSTSSIDLLAIQVDLPTTETQISIAVQAGSPTGENCSAGVNWQTGWDSSPVFNLNSNPSGANPKILTHQPSITQPYRCWQYRIIGKTDGNVTWIVRDAFLIPQPDGYGKLKLVADKANTYPTNIQEAGDGRYFQYLILGSSNGSAAWNLDKVELTSKFSYFEIGKRYQIARASLTDNDDLLYRIHYSLENTDNYLSVTAWQDTEDKIASNTLSHTFPASTGQALRWLRFNRVSNTGSPPTSPAAIAFLAKEANVYTIKKGDDTALTRREGGTTRAYYELTLPDAAIGKTSTIQTYQICAGPKGDLRYLTIKALPHPEEESQGYKCASLSWEDSTDETKWIDANEGPGGIATITPQTLGYGPEHQTLSKETGTTPGGCKPFYLRTRVPATGVTEGPKKIRFYFEGEVL